MSSKEQKTTDEAAIIATVVTAPSAPSRTLSAADILKVVPPSILEIPELGGHVCVQQLPARDVIEFTRRTKEDRDDAMTQLIAACVVDDNGARIFNALEAADLLNTSIVVFNRLASAAVNMTNAGAEITTEKKA